MNFKIEKIEPLKHFKYYYGYLKYRIFVGLVLSIFVGLLDGVGLVFFFPLLGMAGGNGAERQGEDAMGNFDFFTTFFEGMNIEMSFDSILLIILVIFIFKGGVKWIQGIYMVNVQRDLVVKIRKESINLFKDFKYSAYTRSDSGRIQNTLTGGISAVIKSYNAYFSTLQQILTGLVYIALAFVANMQFALFVFAGGVVTSLMFKLIYSRTKDISRRLTNNAHGFQGKLIQAVGFFKYLKSTGTIKKYSEKLIQLIDEAEIYNRKMGRISALLNAVKEPVVIVVMLGVIYLQVSVFGESIFTVLLSLILFYRALNSMIGVGTTWNVFLTTTGAVENMKEFVNELKLDTETYGQIGFDSLKEGLFLKDVSFNYKGGETILQDISVYVSKNQTVAFVGESGSGKTTTVNLLSGLSEPVSGKYLIDGVNSQELDMREFQSKIGYITQEPIVFDDTVFNNVTFWDEPTSENLDRFWKALRGASVEHFVSELAEQENTRLGNNGVMVSGGQKQRISIARELYKDIDILIMDEATSALDTETERAIQDNIDALKGRYTIIIVAHRLSTIKNADQIILMDKGDIADKGTFEELKEKNANFNRMVALQEI